ncbi:putative membrane protein YesL [Streptohalobacillus salinus]|uniref:Putative membrane protein YesL n=1 Tax=Streptohalobacillus salinus TaxID=621096 RepID=A0A2V3WDV9_9BACI|nr:putative membrane protein YesL [Streptohalobacillus salinus]
MCCLVGEKARVFITLIYYYVVLALYFWLGILKGLLLYGVTPSFVALLHTHQAMRRTEELDETYIKKTFWLFYKQYDHAKVQSFILSVSSLLLLAMFTYSLFQGWSIVFVLVIIYFLLLLFGAASYMFYYLTSKQAIEKSAFAIGFVQMVREIKITLPLLVSIVVLLGIAYYNLFLFIVVAPTIYAAVVNGLMSRRTKE